MHRKRLMMHAATSTVAELGIEVERSFDNAQDDILRITRMARIVNLNSESVFVRVIRG